MQHFGLRLVATLLGFAGSTGIAHAQWDTTGTMQSRISSGLYGLGKWSGFIPPEGPPRNFVPAVGILVRTLLTFLGVLFLLLVIYAGFTWMTAAGNSEKVDKAKTMMGQATVGLALILMAYLLSVAIIYVLQVSINQP